MKWYWHSFSFNGKNQGCCIVAAETQELALQKTIDLNIHPAHDSIKVYSTDSISDIQEEDLELDRLYSKKELVELGYETQ